MPRIGAQPRLQSSTQRSGGIPLVRSARGVLMRGVIVRTHSFDADPQVACMDRRTPPVAQYADVLCYTSMRGGRYHYLPRCLVTRESGGVHDGDIAAPRPNKHGFGRLTSGNDFVNTKTSPAMMDGDHVLVGFLDDRCEQGVILRHLPHPRADTGKAADAELGDRLRITGDGETGDGTPRAIKHQGVVVGVTANGGWLLDARRAHRGFAGDGTAGGGGGYDAKTGDEVASTQIDPATNFAAAGNVRIRMPDNAPFAVEYPPVGNQDAAERFRMLQRAGSESTAELMSDLVRIGSPVVGVDADEAAVLGTTWGDARNTLNRDVDTRLENIANATATLVTKTANYAGGSGVTAPGGVATALADTKTFAIAVGEFLAELLIQISAIRLSIDSFERPTTGADPSSEEANAYLSNHVYFVEETT